MFQIISYLKKRSSTRCWMCVRELMILKSKSMFSYQEGPFNVKSPRPCGGTAVFATMVTKLYVYEDGFW